MELFTNKRISYQIFFNLSPSNILDDSSLNKNTYAIYNDEYFWEQYCNKNYFVFEKNEAFTWQKIAFYCESVLNVLFSNNVFPSYRILQTLFLKMEYHMFDLKIFNNIGNKEMYSLTYLIDNLDGDLYEIDLQQIANNNITYKYMTEFYGLNKILENSGITPLDQNFPKFDSNDTSIDEFEVSQLQYINDIFQLIKTPTVYLIPSVTEGYNHSQHYTINYDIDIYYLFLSQEYDQITDLLLDDMKINTIKYFADIMQ